MSGKIVQVLTEAVSGLSRVAILWNSANPANALLVKEAQEAVQALGLPAQLLGVHAPNEFDRAVAAIARERAEALIVLNEPLVLMHRTRLAELIELRRYVPFCDRVRHLPCPAVHHGVCQSV
jgi:putative ABC transport system substrate-binding protein